MNPAAPKSPFLRFIHSVFQSPGTLSTVLLPVTLDIASYAYSAPIRVTAIHSKSTARSLQNLLRTVCGFTLVLEPKVFRQPKVQVVSNNLPEIDMELGFYGVRYFIVMLSIVQRNSEMRLESLQTNYHWKSSIISSSAICTHSSLSPLTCYSWRNCENPQ